MLNRRHCVLAGAVLALACSARGTGAQAPAAPPVSAPVALLRQLDKVSIDPGQIYALRNARLERGGVSFYFDRGFIGFFRPVEGEVTGAVFAGNAEVLLIPPGPVEKLSLAQFTGSAVLEERCDFVYMRFTGHEAQDLLAQSHRPDPQDPEQPGDFAGHWEPMVARLNPVYSVRVLEDLLGERDKPLFAAQVEGLHLGMFNVGDDERLPENVIVTALKHVQGITYTDVWCSYASPASRARQAALEAGNARAVSYDIHTRVLKDNSLQGRTVVELQSLSSLDRVVIFKLSSHLRVQSVKDEGGAELPVLWPTREEESGTGKRESDWVAVVLPAAYPVGTKFRLTFTYAGNVIANVGNGVLYVGARESWYPNRGLNMRAPYVLSFVYPDTLTLVATGQCVEEGSADGWKHSRWISDGPFPVAGFNLGAYQERTRQVGKVRVEVYATREAEAALVRLLTPREPPVPFNHRLSGGEGGMRTRALPSPPVVLDPAALLDRVAERAARAINYFETLFGPFPYPRLALSQVPGNFGQGWPELVYLPTLSFFVGDRGLDLQAQQGLRGLEEQLFVSHEIAHQWWGNEVGWKTYHDQWLSEGFASYAAALELARGKDGERKFRQLLRQYKQDLLSKAPDGKSVESGGPIWLGQRLSNSRDPRGYDAIVYKKACWVLHMLRCLMTGPRTGSDERFFKMLRDFEDTYRGRAPCTQDFIKVADRYMTPEMDLDHHHALEWFFSDWVYGTGIPVYKIRSTTRRLKSGGYLTTGTIEQSGVPDGFEMLVPLVARAGKDTKVALGRVVVGPTGSFRFRTSFKPARITVDEDELLARVE
jgi:Peptidase family M1 domain